MVSRNQVDPVHPAGFGEQLRRTREGAGLAVEDIVAETKISSRILNALERGDFASLPERVFARSFVGQYARTVGVDERPLLASFDTAWDEHTRESGSHVRLDVKPDDLGLPIRWRFWIPIATGVVILLVAATVILRGSTPPGQGLAPDPRRSGARSTLDAGESAPMRVPTHAPSPVTTSNVATPGTLVRMTVEVEPGEECWIHFRDRDGMTGERLLTGGQKVALELTGPVKLTVGNAGAVSVTVDGRTYQDLGQPGQVIHTEVSDHGFVPLDPRGFEG